MDNKKIHVPALVLMIIGLIFALISPLVAYILCTISLVMSIVKRKQYKTTYAIVLNVVGLLIAVANNIVGMMMLM